MERITPHNRGETAVAWALGTYGLLASVPGLVRDRIMEERIQAQQHTGEHEHRGSLRTALLVGGSALILSSAYGRTHNQQTYQIAAH